MVGGTDPVAAGLALGRPGQSARRSIASVAQALYICINRRITVIVRRGCALRPEATVYFGTVYFGESSMSLNGLIVVVVSGVLGVVCLSSTHAAPADATDARGGGGIEEVVVTARRREETIQDVPIPVTALSGEDLKDR